MLSTIIYRSHLTEKTSIKILEDLAINANKINELFDITGILLFNGTHFFQLLEGPEEAVLAIYQRICNDCRHHNLVELLRDYAPSRRFGNAGMELFDLRKYDKTSVLQAVLDKGTSKFQLTYDDRALQFLRTFVEATEKENYFEIPPADYWDFIIDENSQPEKAANMPGSQEFNFALQPIIDPFAREVVALEALVQSGENDIPLLSSAQRLQNGIYETDLKSKKYAFALAKRLEIAGQTLSIKLLPMSLVMVPDAVSFLLQEIAAHGLIPEQIVIEVTENEVISRVEEVKTAIKQLKAAGISLAIDNFGAGYAGLLLLSEFQPDRIKIDRSIICDIHKDGPKQAIVQAIIKCCASLEITVIATGITQPEEWMWLEAAGVCNFQGDLFAKAKLNAIPAVAWPEKN